MKNKIFFLAMVSIMSIGINSTCFAARFSDVSERHWANVWIEGISSVNIINGYPDGTFAPDKKLKAGEFLKMFITAYHNKYKYVAPAEGEHWAMQYANLVKSIIGEDYTTKEKLDAEITREQMSILVAFLAGRFNSSYEYDEKLRSLNNISDSSAISADAKDFVDFCIKYEIINGFEDGTFRPQDALTRAQAAKVIYKCLYN